MTFLNPLYLLGLAAAAIPIILHLLTLRKARVVEFSTLTFLKELQRNRIRRLKIRQWLLLALRTLVIVFAVLAFTRPALRSTLGFLPGSQARSSVVIVIDDSFSMFASDERGPLIRQARERARAVLELLDAGDEVAVIRMSRSADAHRFTAALGAARDEIEAIEPSFRHVRAADALTAAAALVAQSRNINREVYFITDEQRSHYGLEQLPGALFDPSIRVFVLPLGAKAPDNTAVTDVTIETAMFEAGKPVDISATVFNNSTTARQGALVSVFLDGARVAQSSVDIPAGGRTQARFSVTPARSGFVRGFVELEDDDIPEDNSRHFAFQVPDRLRVLLSARDPREAAILRAALQPAPDLGTTFSITTGDRAALLSADLRTVDVVVLSGAEGVQPAALDRLAAWVRDGGGVLALPDAEGGVDAYASALRALGLPAPAGRAGEPGRTAQWSSFTSVDYEHPLFRGVFAKDRRDGAAPAIESPRMYAYVRLRAGDRARTVIAAPGGDGVLVDHREQRGRVLALGLPASLSWSDLPVKGVFVPLINRSMYYLTAREDVVRTSTVGEPFDLVLPPMSAPTWTLRTPAGDDVLLQPRTLATGTALALRDLEQPGVYELRAGESPQRAVAVNIDETESDLTRITEEERASFLARLGVTTPIVIAPGGAVRQAITEARFGVELWKYLLALAILCAIAEMLVARDAKRRASDELE